VPAGASTGPITITNFAGVVTSSQLLYFQPVIAFFTARAAIGEAMEIRGSNFTGITEVKFGQIPATSFTVLSATNLQAVLKRILGDLPGQEAQDLYESIQTNADKFKDKPEFATATVLDHIINLLEFVGPPPLGDGEDAIRISDLTGWADGLPVGRSRPLANLLRVGNIRTRLLRPDGVIAKNVQIAISQFTGDEGPPPRFSMEDHLFTLQGLPGLPQELNQILMRLNDRRKSEGAEWRRITVELLDQCLNDAIGTILGLSNSISLVEVMAEARRLLKKQKRVPPF
jgi:hypothetical protein